MVHFEKFLFCRGGNLKKVHAKTRFAKGIPVVVLKNCEPELLYVLAELFNKCLKESCSPDCLKVLSVIPIFKNIEEQSTSEDYCPVSLLSVVGKVFEKLS